MKIDDHILKHYLKNCYFINGTAYAGKSTMCKLLSEKYNMLHMEENYETNRFCLWQGRTSRRISPIFSG